MIRFKRAKIIGYILVEWETIVEDYLNIKYLKLVVDVNLGGGSSSCS